VKVDQMETSTRAARPREIVKQRGRLLRGAQLLGLALLVAGVITALLPNGANGSVPTNGPVSLRSTGPSSPGPFSSGQNIDIVIAANSTMSRSSLTAAGYPSGAVPIKVLECADPRAMTANLPTKPTSCEPATIDSIPVANADGSMTIQDFTVYALPDSVVLGPSNGTKCDDAQHACVIGIFADQNDFTKPHLFSAPFYVGPTTAAGAKAPVTTGSTGTSTPTTTVTARQVAAPAGTGGRLAATGSSDAMPWLIGFGVLLLILGTVGRRTVAARPRG
jgi:hypothetical protein